MNNKEIALKAAAMAAQSGMGKTEIRHEIIELVENPESYRDNRVFKELAEAFIPNPDGKPHVNHISGQKDDNKPENLEWVTKREDIMHRIHVLKKHGWVRKKEGEHPQSKPILQIDVLTDVVIAEFPSLSSVRKIGLNSQSIFGALSGRQKTAKGFKWKYKQEQ